MFLKKSSAAGLFQHIVRCFKKDCQTGTQKTILSFVPHNVIDGLNEMWDYPIVQLWLFNGMG
jgi:hypothetical protein